MADLTVTEKNYWQDRVRDCFGAAIQEIEEKYPTVINRAQREAEVKAIAALGLAEYHQDLQTINAERVALDHRKRRTQRTMLALFQRVPLEQIPPEVTPHSHCPLGLPSEVYEEVESRASRIFYNGPTKG